MTHKKEHKEKTEHTEKKHHKEHKEKTETHTKEKKPNKKMSTKKIIVIAVIVLFLGLLYALTIPTEQEPIIIASPEGSQIYGTLLAAGIEDAVVDIHDDGTVIVDFAIPEGAEKEAVVGYVMSVAATIVPESTTISMMIYEGEDPVEEITVSTADVTAAINGTLSVADLESRIQTSQIQAA